MNNLNDIFFKENLYSLEITGENFTKQFVEAIVDDNVEIDGDVHKYHAQIG